MAGPAANTVASVTPTLRPLPTLLSVIETAYDQEDFLLAQALLNLAMAHHRVQAIEKEQMTLKKEVLLPQMRQQLLSQHLVEFYQTLQTQLIQNEPLVAETGSQDTFNKTVGEAHRKMTENVVENHATLNNFPFLPLQFIQTSADEAQAFSQIIAYQTFLKQNGDEASRTAFQFSIESTVLSYYANTRFLTSDEINQAENRPDDLPDTFKHEVITSIRLIRDTLSTEAHHALAQKSPDFEQVSAERVCPSLTEESAYYQVFKKIVDEKLNKLMSDQDQKVTIEQLTRQREEHLATKKRLFIEYRMTCQKEVEKHLANLTDAKNAIYAAFLAVESNQLFTQILGMAISLESKTSLTKNTWLHYACALFNQAKRNKEQEILAGFICDLALATGFLNEENAAGQTPFSFAGMNYEVEGIPAYYLYLEAMRFQNLFISQQQKQPNCTPSQIQDAFLAVRTKNVRLAAVLFGALIPHEEQTALCEAETTYWEKELNRVIFKLIFDLYDFFFTELNKARQLNGEAEEDQAELNTKLFGITASSIERSKESIEERMKKLRPLFISYRQKVFKEGIFDFERLLDQQLINPRLKGELIQAFKAALIKISTFSIPAPTDEILKNEAKQQASLFGKRTRAIQSESQKNQNKKNKKKTPSIPWSYHPSELILFVDEKRVNYQKKYIEINNAVIEAKVKLNAAFQQAQASRKKAREKTLMQYFSTKAGEIIYPPAEDQLGTVSKDKNWEALQRKILTRVKREMPVTDGTSITLTPILDTQPLVGVPYQDEATSPLSSGIPAPESAAAGNDRPTSDTSNPIQQPSHIDTTQDSHSEQVYQTLFDVRVPQDVVDEFGNTFLHYAAMTESVIIAGLCLAHGASFDILNKAKNQPHQAGIFQNDPEKGACFKTTALCTLHKGSILQQTAFTFYKQESAFLDLIEKVATKLYSFEWVAKKEKEEADEEIIVLSQKKQILALETGHYWSLIFDGITHIKNHIKTYREELNTLQCAITEAQTSLNDLPLLTHLEELTSDASKEWTVALKRTMQLKELETSIKSIKKSTYEWVLPPNQPAYISHPKKEAEISQLKADKHTLITKNIGLHQTVAAQKKTIEHLDKENSELDQENAGLYTRVMQGVLPAFQLNQMRGEPVLGRSTTPLPDAEKMGPRAT